MTRRFDDVGEPVLVAGSFAVTGAGGGQCPHLLPAWGGGGEQEQAVASVGGADVGCA